LGILDGDLFNQAFSESAVVKTMADKDEPAPPELYA
jgi:hypothetical protein